MATCKLGRELSPQTDAAGTLTLDVGLQNSEKINFFKSPVMVFCCGSPNRARQPRYQTLGISSWDLLPGVTDLALGGLEHKDSECQESPSLVWLQAVAQPARAPQGAKSRDFSTRDRPRSRTGHVCPVPKTQTPWGQGA